MSTIRINICIGVVFICILLSSCYKEEAEEPIDKRAGILTGKVVGKQWTITNATIELERLIMSGGIVISSQQRKDFYWDATATIVSKPFPVSIDGDSVCLHMGIYPLTAWYRIFENDTIMPLDHNLQIYICNQNALQDNPDLNRKRILYVPKSGCSTNVEEIHLKSEASNEFHIAGYVYGTLYNLYAPFDTIQIDMHYNMR